MDPNPTASPLDVAPAVIGLQRYYGWIRGDERWRRRCWVRRVVQEEVDEGEGKQFGHFGRVEFRL